MKHCVETAVAQFEALQCAKVAPAVTAHGSRPQGSTGRECRRCRAYQQAYEVHLADTSGLSNYEIAFWSRLSESMLNLPYDTGCAVGPAQRAAVTELDAK